MKRKTRSLALFLVLVILTGPTWLYASGNLPLFFPVPQHHHHMVSTVNGSLPGPAATTFVELHRVFGKLRGWGFDIPMTYNERVLSIARTKLEVTAICRGIIMGK